MRAAEGSSSPYYSDANEESPRMERIAAIVRRQPDASKIIFYVGKSNNDNFVAYRYSNEKSNLESFWISTENVPSERRENLNLAEMMLYGHNLEVTSSNEWLIRMNVEQLQDRPMSLVLDDDEEAHLVAPINGEMCILQHAYVQMSPGLLPSVDYIRVSGITLDKKKPRFEIIKNNS